MDTKTNRGKIFRFELFFLWPWTNVNNRATKTTFVLLIDQNSTIHDKNSWKFISFIFSLQTWYLCMLVSNQKFEVHWAIKLKISSSLKDGFNDLPNINWTILSQLHTPSFPQFEGDILMLWSCTFQSTSFRHIVKLNRRTWPLSQHG